VSEPDPTSTEYIVLEAEPGLPDTDLPGVYMGKLLARSEMVAEGQEYLRFHEGEIVWAYPTPRVTTLDGGQAQVWTVSKTLPHDWDPSFPRDEP
jgi:hypothetical protein